MKMFIKRYAFMESDSDGLGRLARPGNVCVWMRRKRFSLCDSIGEKRVEV